MTGTVTSSVSKMLLLPRYILKEQQRHWLFPTIMVYRLLDERDSQNRFWSRLDLQSIVDRKRCQHRKP
ncbi:hypothetical protein NECAME_12575, partial [Necator americanus]